MNLYDLKTRKALMAEMGRRGGIARAKKITADRCKEIARRAANVRWKNITTEKDKTENRLTP